MTVHLRKLCVGATSIDDLAAWQAQRLIDNDGKIWHQTRNWPKRREELLDGGSLYWIIKGKLSVRQTIIGFEEAPQDDLALIPQEILEAVKPRKPACRICLDPLLVPIFPRSHRPFQGWRYLITDDAPKDLPSGQSEGEIPADLEIELRDLGVL